MVMAKHKDEGLYEEIRKAVRKASRELDGNTYPIVSPSGKVTAKELPETFLKLRSEARIQRKSGCDCLGECNGSCVTRDIQRSYE